LLLVAGIAAAAAIGGPRAVRAAGKASDHAAQAAARDGLAAANEVYKEDSSYRNAQPLRLKETVPGVRFTTDTSTDFRTASVLATDEQFVIAVASITGRCWVLISAGDGAAREAYLNNFQPCNAQRAATDSTPRPFE
jgi:type II secretory pathway pseudopilin PulG